ncbi:MAG: twin-arginine translocation signal domain-containing protein [Selenomonadaceae bacterium]|nr:twin-arginine translocation signal domain-containing protein [Selenomonadaceae bacterium]
MNRREFIKTIGVGAVGLMAGGLPLDVEGRKKRMEIKTVKLYENGFMTQPFACGLEDGVEKFRLST